jgi:hypothetical protein
VAPAQALARRRGDLVGQVLQQVVEEARVADDLRGRGG